MPPVDPKIIPLLRQHRLVLRTDPKRHQPPLPLRHFRPRPDDRLLGRVIHRPLAGRIEINADLVRLTVRRPHLPRQIRHRPRKHVQVIRQQRRKKRHRQPHAARLKLVHRARRQHLQPLLLHRRHIPRPLPRPPVGLPINAHHPAHRHDVLIARPVLGKLVRQMVRHRPHAEIGVVRHQRHCRRAERRKLVRLRGSANH